jgi:uncharacterized DUF497 family protein
MKLEQPVGFEPATTGTPSVARLIRRAVDVEPDLVYRCTQGAVVEFERDPNKAASNLRRHEVRFAEAVTIFEGDEMLTMPDDDPDEERFVALGIGSRGRVLVVIYTARRDRIRIVSARKATPRERSEYEGRHK